MMRDLADGRTVQRHQLGQVLAGYKAAVDIPSCEFLEDVLKENPDIKVGRREA